jgi:hypothetical protein
MTNEEIFPCYAALWRRVPVDDLYIHYEAHLPRGAAGCFDHDPPEIGIARPYYVEPYDEPSMERSDGTPVNLAAEMLTLAHEYGHFLSFSGGTPADAWQAYYRAASHRDEVFDALPDGTSAEDCRREVTKALSDEERNLIVAEETLAWVLGREFVPERLLAEYERRARLGVHNHKYRLGIDALWPEDESALDTSVDG